MLISCDKTFPSVPKEVTLTLTFDILLKQLTLAITFEPKEIGLSYYTYVFLVARLFLYQKF